MKITTLANTNRSRIALALFSGLLLAAAFPRLGIAGFAWIAPGLMLWAALGEQAGSAFRLGLLAGLAHYLSSLYWLLFIPFPVGAVSAWLTLSAYCALYPATWVWLCWKIFPKAKVRNQVSGTGSPEPVVKGEDSVFPQPPPFTPHTSRITPEPSTLNPQLSTQFLAASSRQRILWALACAALWVALEMTLGRLFSGFPWNFLGVSQYQMLPLIQVASVTGVYGVSFMVVWTAVSLACAGIILIYRPSDHWAWRMQLLWPALAVIAVMMWGGRRLFEPVQAGRELKIALVQPSIPQRLIWDPQETPARFNQLIRLSELALATKPDLLVWPEAALPSLSPEMYGRIVGLVTTNQVWMILGSDDVERTETATNFFNSAFLLNSRAGLEAKYHKRRLVIFGEYVPLDRWLPFMKYLTPIGGSFSAGKQPVPFRLASLQVTTSALICFEDNFPHLAREHASGDIDFLLNLANNGWFGESAAQWQHAANTVFRAVENGLPLVRCSNNGLTCWVDPGGRLHDVYFDDSKNIYQAGFKTVLLPLPSPGQKRAPTFYHEHGDWFGWSCVGVSTAIFMVRVVRLRIH